MNRSLSVSVLKSKSFCTKGGALAGSPSAGDEEKSGCDSEKHSALVASLAASGTIRDSSVQRVWEPLPTRATKCKSASSLKHRRTARLSSPVSSVSRKTETSGSWNSFPAIPLLILIAGKLFQDPEVFSIRHSKTARQALLRSHKSFPSCALCATRHSVAQPSPDFKTNPLVASLARCC